MNLKQLLRSKRNRLEMEAASVLIVHLALSELTRKERRRWDKLLAGDVYDYELAEALTEDSFCHITSDDVQQAREYLASDSFATSIDDITGDVDEVALSGCVDWSDVMQLVFPKNSFCVNERGPAVTTAPESPVLGFDGSRPADTYVFNIANAYPIVEDTGPGSAYDKALRGEFGLEDLKEYYGVDGPNQMGVTEDSCPMPEPSDCGAPIVHEANVRFVCSEPECACFGEECGSCTRGRHAWLEQR